MPWSQLPMAAILESVTLLSNIAQEQDLFKRYRCTGMYKSLLPGKLNKDMSRILISIGNRDAHAFNTSKMLRRRSNQNDGFLKGDRPVIDNKGEGIDREGA